MQKEALVGSTFAKKRTGLCIHAEPGGGYSSLTLDQGNGCYISAFYASDWPTHSGQRVPFLKAFQHILAARRPDRAGLKKANPYMDVIASRDVADYSKCNNED